jgi:single-strand DNA-binding protein
MAAVSHQRSNEENLHTMNTSMKNKVQLIGQLGQDPELKGLGKGQHLLRLRLATNERYKGQDGEWKSDTQWHAVVVWGKQAEKLAAEVTKGSGLLVEGRLVHRKYESKTGETRYSTEVVMSEYQLLAKAKGQAQQD